MEHLPLVALIGCFLTLAIGGYVLRGLPNAAPESDTQRLRFAAATMTGLMLVFLFGMSLYASNASGTAGKEIFDGLLKVLPPLATLVLGFWFGSKK